MSNPTPIIPGLNPTPVVPNGMPGVPNGPITPTAPILPAPFGNGGGGSSMYDGPIRIRVLPSRWPLGTTYEVDPAEPPSKIRRFPPTKLDKPVWPELPSTFSPWRDTKILGGLDWPSLEKPTPKPSLIDQLFSDPPGVPSKKTGPLWMPEFPVDKVIPGVKPTFQTPLADRLPPLNFKPGDPIPPGMPPAWGGVKAGRLQEIYPRPPYAFEKVMLNPKWNPDGLGVPTIIPNPNYDPNVPVPPAIAEQNRLLGRSPEFPIYTPVSKIPNNPVVPRIFEPVPTPAVEMLPKTAVIEIVPITEPPATIPGRPSSSTTTPVPVSPGLPKPKIPTPTNVPLWEPGVTGKFTEPLTELRPTLVPTPGVAVVGRLAGAVRFGFGALGVIGMIAALFDDGSSHYDAKKECAISVLNLFGVSNEKTLGSELNGFTEAEQILIAFREINASDAKKEDKESKINEILDKIVAKACEQFNKDKNSLKYFYGLLEVVYNSKGEAVTAIPASNYGCKGSLGLLIYLWSQVSICLCNKQPKVYSKECTDSKNNLIKEIMDFKFKLSKFMFVISKNRIAQITNSITKFCTVGATNYNAICCDKWKAKYDAAVNIQKSTFFGLVDDKSIGSWLDDLLKLISKVNCPSQCETSGWREQLDFDIKLFNTMKEEYNKGVKAWSTFEKDTPDPVGCLAAELDGASSASTGFAFTDNVYGVSSSVGSSGSSSSSNSSSSSSSSSSNSSSSSSSSSSNSSSSSSGGLVNFQIIIKNSNMQPLYGRTITIGSVSKTTNSFGMVTFSGLSAGSSSTTLTLSGGETTTWFSTYPGGYSSGSGATATNTITSKMTSDTLFIIH